MNPLNTFYVQATSWQASNTLPSLRLAMLAPQRILKTMMYKTIW